MYEFTITELLFKGTVSVISSDSPYNDDNARNTTKENRIYIREEFTRKSE